METAKSNVELIDKFIDNEHKSRAWTILTVVLFSLLAMLVLFFAYKLQKTNKELDITKDSLQIAYAMKDSLVNVWKQQASIAERNLNELDALNDSLQREYDIMSKLFNESQKQYFNNNPEQANAQLSRISSQLFTSRADAKITAQVQQMIINPQKAPAVSDGFLLFIQCMPGFEDKTDKISELLKKNYRVQPKQVMKDFTFDPGVKYYRDEDKAAADNIATVINNSDPFFKDHPTSVKKLTLKTSYHQVEVWIGDYVKQDPKQFLLKTLSNKLKAD